MYRAGLRDLRITYVYKPKWYFRKAEEALKSVVESYIGLFGSRRFLAAFSSPIFFDALAASAYLDELGGGATSIIAVTLKNHLRPEAGLMVLGGKQPISYRVPEELERAGELLGLSEREVERLKYSSRMVAKVDSAAIQDGFKLYIHVMLVSAEAEWSVVQQAIRPMTNIVRRYHWASMKVRSFIEEPHSGIVSEERRRVVLDMTSRRSRESRKACVEAVNQDLRGLKRFSTSLPSGQLTLLDFGEAAERSGDEALTVPRIKWSTITRIHRMAPRDFEELLSIQGVGPATVRFLAYACMSLYGVKPSLSDPATLFNEVRCSREDRRYLEELAEAIDSSSLPEEKKRRSLSRVSALLSQAEPS